MRCARLGCPVDGARVVDHLAGVHVFHRLEAGDSGKDQLAPAAVSGPEVWFDEAGQDFQVGVEIVAVAVDRNAGPRLADVAKFAIILGKRI